MTSSQLDISLKAMSSFWAQPKPVIDARSALWRLDCRWGRIYYRVRPTLHLKIGVRNWGLLKNIFKSFLFFTWFLTNGSSNQQFTSIDTNDWGEVLLPSKFIYGYNWIVWINWTFMIRIQSTLDIKICSNIYQDFDSFLTVWTQLIVQVQDLFSWH